MHSILLVRTVIASKSEEPNESDSLPKKSEFFRPIFVASSGGAITVDILLVLVLLLVLSGAKAFVKERRRDTCTRSAVTSIIIFCFLEKIILIFIE